MVFVNVKGGSSEPSGTPFINAANARFVVEFAASLIRRAPLSYRLMKSAVTPLTFEPLTTHRALKQRSSYGIWFVRTSRDF
ncbi:hypothetical protein GGI43DRAFT_426829 [Trichoderma evansii]